MNPAVVADICHLSDRLVASTANLNYALARNRKSKSNLVGQCANGHIAASPVYLPSNSVKNYTIKQGKEW